MGIATSHALPKRLFGASSPFSVFGLLPHRHTQKIYSHLPCPDFINPIRPSFIPFVIASTLDIATQWDYSQKRNVQIQRRRVPNFLPNSILPPLVDRRQ